MSSIILDTPSTSTWLKPSTDRISAPFELWELHVTIIAEDGRIFARAPLNRMPPSGLFSERTDADVWTTKTSPGSLSCLTDVDGERVGDIINMDVHIVPDGLRLTPMSCYGVANSDHKEYEGDLTMACLYPATCGCDGLTGTFRLTAV